MSDLAPKILLYGATGYSGQLIARQAFQQGLPLILGGRNQQALSELAEEWPVSTMACSLDQLAQHQFDPQIKLVLNSAGPFAQTAESWWPICLDRGWHYLDLTGEYQVIAAAQQWSARFANAGLTLLPAIGFDVVPSDCLAARLHELLPSATHLLLAFTGLDRFSRGTARTMLQAIGTGAVIRRQHHLEPAALGHFRALIHFGEYRAWCGTVPWGDVVSAAHSTGIGNIEVLMSMPLYQLWGSSTWTRLLSWLMRKSWVQQYLAKQIERLPPGPNEQQLQTETAALFGCAIDANAQLMITGTLHTPNPYALTVNSSLLCAKQVLNYQVPVGFQTPSSAFGWEICDQLPGCQWQMQPVQPLDDLARDWLKALA